MLASVLLGIGIKVGVGLAATAAKQLLGPATPVNGARAAESFPRLLKARSITDPAEVSVYPGAASVGGPARPAPVVPYEVPGRLAAADRLHSLALDLEARRGLPSPAALPGYYAKGSVAAYRRLDRQLP